MKIATSATPLRSGAGFSTGLPGCSARRWRRCLPLPKELVLSIAALALFGSIINGLSIAMSEVKEREAALVTFMVTASGLTLFSIGSAFWGIVAGVLTLLILNWRKA